MRCTFNRRDYSPDINQLCLEIEAKYGEIYDDTY